MDDRQAWDRAFDPHTGRRLRQDEIEPGSILPSSRWPNFFSRVVAKLQWDAQSIDLGPDAEAWPGLPEERRDRLTKLLAGFRIADDAVSRAPRAVRPRRQRLADRVGRVPAAPRRAAPREVLRPRRRRGAQAARRHGGRAPRGGPGARSGRDARALRGAAARDGGRDGGGPHGPERRHGAVPHDARGHGAVRRAARAARRAGGPRRCRASARACTTSSSTSAGTSASACAA